MQCELYSWDWFSRCRRAIYINWISLHWQKVICIFFPPMQMEQDSIRVEYQRIWFWHRHLWDNCEHRTLDGLNEFLSFINIISYHLLHIRNLWSFFFFNIYLYFYWLAIGKVFISRKCKPKNNSLWWSRCTLYKNPNRIMAKS